MVDTTRNQPWLGMVQKPPMNTYDIYDHLGMDYVPPEISQVVMIIPTTMRKRLWDYKPK